MDIIDIEKPGISILPVIDEEMPRQVDMLRLDQVHPVVSGNKWFKLKYNLRHALEQKCSAILTFGGAYSNHLHATAAAARASGLKSIGLVRGHLEKENYTPTLKQCETLGMELHFLSRDNYKLKESEERLQEIISQFPGGYLIPEGGNNELGRKGVEEIMSFIPAAYTHVAVSVGSGTTFTGLRNVLPEQVQLTGFVPMKKGAYLAAELVTKKDNWQLIDQYHFGGFGKWDEELIRFMNRFYQMHQIPLDIVYTSKMMYGISQLLRQHYFPAEAKILCIHTGGLQGNASVSKQLVF